MRWPIPPASISGVPRAGAGTRPTATVPANAAGYAFEVALGAMCKECLETKETLQKQIQALNQGFANSCQLAKGPVNDVADAFDMKRLRHPVLTVL
jgi:hypothetical protein